jgi:hypothetical protein
MTFEEAEQLSRTVKWKADVCSSGEICWCRTIEPVEPILFFDEFGDKVPFYVVRAGDMHKDLAEYFVKLHNQKIEK